MSALIPFRQTGPTVTIVAGTSDGEAQQAVSTEQIGNQQYILTNTGSNPAAVCMAPTEDAALRGCILPTVQLAQNVYILLNGSQITITGPQDAWFAAITTTGSSQVWITPGYGQ
jgi:hypothetical protein